jgi:hypothetical protein
MCIVHKGFRGFRAVLPASIFGGNLMGWKPAIPYDTIHSTLGAIARLNFFINKVRSKTPRLVFTIEDYN